LNEYACVNKLAIVGGGIPILFYKNIVFGNSRRTTKDLIAINTVGSVEIQIPNIVKSQSKN